MHLKKVFVAIISLIFFVSYAGAKIYVVKDGKTEGYQEGSIVNFQNAAAIIFQGIKIGLTPETSYTFEEIVYEGKKALIVKCGGFGVLTVGGNILKMHESGSAVILTPNEDSPNKLNVKVLEGGMGVTFSNNSNNVDTKTHYAAGDSFSMTILDFVIDRDNHSHYRQSKRDSVRPVSVSNP